MSKYNQLCRQINKNSAELRFNQASIVNVITESMLDSF